MEKFLDSREARKGLDLEESFGRFEKAAAKGHEESIWISIVVKDAKMEKSALKEAFAKIEEPLGWFFAGKLSAVRGREQFDFYKKSAEGGCSWGQVAYGIYFKQENDYVEVDENAFVEWSEKAANQNNPFGLMLRADRFRSAGESRKEFLGFCSVAELGFKRAMIWLGESILNRGFAHAGEAVMWFAKGHDPQQFFDIMDDARTAWDERGLVVCDFGNLCYWIGWGLYWYLHGTHDWNLLTNEQRVFGSSCLDYYCSCVELQQKSIWTFLLCWKETVGVYDVGMAIAEMVWEAREDNLVKRFEQMGGEEPEMKRIKK
jgi:hypothetical protein